MIQQDHLQIFDLTLNVWAPLFVGNGSSYTKKEYMYNTRNGKVSFLDEQKFFSFLVEHDLVDRYGQFMLSEQSNLWAFLSKDCGISDAELKTLTRYQIEVGDALDAEHSLKEIHAFQRNAQGHAYIPGSSIKGALRTAWLLSAVLADRSTGHSLAPNRRATFPEEKYVNQLRLRTLKDGSIAPDAVNSIFRGIQVSDSLPIPDNCMMLAGKTDSATDGGTHSINLCRECVAPGTAIRFKLTLDQSVLKGRITKDSLLEAIQQFDAYYQQTYARHFTLPRSAVNLPQQPYLILGGGSGFFAKSLAYPYLGEKEGLRWTAEQMAQMFRKHKHERDAEKGISPHTMKYARFRGRLYPYGYCGVSIL